MNPNDKITVDVNLGCYSLPNVSSKVSSNDQKEIHRINNIIDDLLNNINSEYEIRKCQGEKYSKDRLNALLGNIGLLQFMTNLSSQMTSNARLPNYEYPKPVSIDG